MAPFLPVRALTNVGYIQIGGKTVSTTATSYVDLGSTSQVKDLKNHKEAVVTVGPITQTSSRYSVVGAGLVTSASVAPEPVVSTTAGEVQDRDTGEYVKVAVFTGAKVAVAASGKERIDLVAFELPGETPEILAGTPALAGAAKAPAMPGGYVLLATVTVTATVEVATVANVVLRG